MTFIWKARKGAIELPLARETETLSMPSSFAPYGEEIEPEPFAGSAHDLLSRGLAVLPVGGETGKRPLMAWAEWTKPPSTAVVDKLTWRHPDANVGIICHLSRVTVVDIDDSALLWAMLECFGDTPLITGTPSGGHHLWYRHAGEQCCNLRDEGFDVDIKGKGGFVVVPPSVARQGLHAGQAYVFERGSWADLGRLPRIREHSLPTTGRQGNDRFASAKASPLRSIAVGRRNETLFRLLLRQAPYCDTFDDLLDVASTINDGSLEEPLPPAEVAKTASSAWGYEQHGDNWAGQEARTVTPKTEFDILQQNLNAFGLLTKLRLEHGARPQPFAVSPEAMAKNEVLTGWRDKRRYQKARDWLIENGFLEQAHIGGRAAGDPHLFHLSTPRIDVESRGAFCAPNITKHPPLERQLGSSALASAESSVTPDEMADPLALGRKLRRLRLEVGWSQAEMASRTGVSRATVGNVETGRLQPSAATRQRLEAALHKQHAA
jgi:DNA-binding XRE family transcriptional regulator